MPQLLALDLGRAEGEAWRSWPSGGSRGPQVAHMVQQRPFLSALNVGKGRGPKLSYLLRSGAGAAWEEVSECAHVLLRPLAELQEREETLAAAPVAEEPAVDLPVL